MFLCKRAIQESILINHNKKIVAAWYGFMDLFWCRKGELRLLDVLIFAWDDTYVHLHYDIQKGMELHQTSGKAQNVGLKQDFNLNFRFRMLMGILYLYLMSEQWTVHYFNYLIYLAYVFIDGNVEIVG